MIVKITIIILMLFLGVCFNDSSEIKENTEIHNGIFFDDIAIGAFVIADSLRMEETSSLKGDTIFHDPIK